VPSGSGWYITLWRNSLVVAGAKVLVAQAVFPKATAMLAQIKYGVRGSVGLTSLLATRVHKAQANSLLWLETVTVLITPMLAVFVLDESCLRYYLAFSTNLRSIMTTWGIGQQGVNAYRHQFCSRTLVSQFSWVWISMLVIEMCAGPAMKLIQAQPRVQELEAKISKLVQRSRCKTESEVLATNHEQQAIKEAYSHQVQIVATYRTLLIGVAFGSLSPLLMLLAPLVAFSNLCAFIWIEQQRLLSSVFGVYTAEQMLARKIIPQHPTTLFSVFAVFSQWAVATSLFVDLKFGIGPICFYSCFWIVGLSVWYYLRWRKVSKLLQNKAMCANEGVGEEVSVQRDLGTVEIHLETNPVASPNPEKRFVWNRPRSGNNAEECSGSTRLDAKKPDSELSESGDDASRMVVAGMQNSKPRKHIDLTTAVMGLQDVCEETGTQAASPGESNATIMARIRRTRQARAEHSQRKKEDEVLTL